MKARRHPSDVITRLNAAGETVMSSGKPVSFVHDGISWKIRPTGWTDANGIHGYGLVTGNAAVQTSRLGARERATKNERNQGTR